MKEKAVFRGEKHYVVYMIDAFLAGLKSNVNAPVYI